MKHVMEVDGVQLSFGERRVLSAIYLKAETGRITGLLGRNGEGKSCLMQVIYGTLDAEKSVRFDGQSVPHAYKRSDLLVYMPQVRFIPASLSLRRICLDCEVRFDELTHWFPDFAGLERTAIGDLSGGERRLVELFTVLKTPSLFAMLDEPFAHIAPVHIDCMKALMLETKKEKGLLITDHLFRHIVEV